jgi:hypothetical protein
VDILCSRVAENAENIKQGLLKVEFQKIVPNKRVGWKFANEVGWKKCENGNRVDSFIWHPRVPANSLIYIVTSHLLAKTKISQYNFNCK